ncbi:LysE family translocator [Pleomorphovibrio marinus]|uniref:LysE family translocator n=1 Tax=Pleomorphovibrio marinus TaxID=2164132 RepID=UPI000E0A2E74|nr:LysE family translocator [Pleomorphovibrio marinus]
MVWPLLEGIGMGVILSLIIGPVFFALIQNSIENGFRHSVFMALGILLSDSIYVLITHFGVNWLSRSIYFQSVLGLVGGIILIGFASASFFGRNVARPNSGGVVFRKTKRRKGFFKGLGLNGINPFVFLFWVSVAGIVNLKESFGAWDKANYYLALLLTVFSLDLVKAYVAQSLSKYVTPRLMQRLNRTVAVLLLFFGIRLFYFGVTNFP